MALGRRLYTNCINGYFVTRLKQRDGPPFTLTLRQYGDINGNVSGLREEARTPRWNTSRHVKSPADWRVPDKNRLFDGSHTNHFTE